MKGRERAFEEYCIGIGSRVEGGNWRNTEDTVYVGNRVLKMHSGP